MQVYNSRSLWFCGIVFIAAVGFSVKVQGMPGPSASWATYFVLLLITAGLSLYPIRTAQDGYMLALTDVAHFAGAILLSPLANLSLIVVSHSILVWQTRNRPGGWLRLVINFAPVALATTMARYLLLVTGALSMTRWFDILILSSVILIYTALQTFYVFMFMALKQSVRLREVEGNDLASFLLDMIPPFLGVMVAALWYSHPWMMLAILPPVVALYRFLSQMVLIHHVDLEPKTGLYNYPYFLRSLGKELTQNRFVRRSCAVIFADMDLLRDVNNRYGHLAGDMVIRNVADVLRRELPNPAVVSRFGGEEFVAMLPGTDLEEAEFLAERVRKAVSASPVLLGNGEQVQVTVSIGVAAFPQHGRSPEELVHQADLAAYAAKGRGRNNVVRAELNAPHRAPPAEPVSEQPRPSPTVPLVTKPVSAPTHSDTPLLPLVVGLGLLAVAGLLFVGPALIEKGLLPLLFWVGVAAASGLLHHELSDSGGGETLVSLGMAVTMAAATVGGAPTAALTAATGTVALLVMGRVNSPIKWVLNTANSVLAALIAGGLMEWAARSASGPWLRLVLLPVLISLVFCVLMNGLVLLVLHKQSGTPLSALWREHIRPMMPQVVAISSVGAYMAAAYVQAGLLGAAIVAVPASALAFGLFQRIRRTQRTLTGLKAAHQELESAQRLQQHTLDELVVTLARIVDARDYAVTGHSLQVAFYAQELAREMGLREAEITRIHMAGLLHDLGKIGIPEAILNKPDRLSADEWEIMREHAALGQRLLADIPQLADVARMIGEHHEHFNGRGYPEGKQGAAISQGGRILAVADALDCMLSDRPYHRARSLPWALSEMDRCSGQQFDPQVVAALQRIAAREGSGYFVNSARREAGFE